MSNLDSIALFFDKGTICIKNSKLHHIPQTKTDEKDEKIKRAFGLHYREIIKYFDQSNLDYTDQAPKFLASPVIETNNLNLRDYQDEAIKNWVNSEMRGCIVLPTGAGKTVVGIKAIEKVNASALIVVPTIDLMEQWTENLFKYLNKDNQNNTKENSTILIGNLGGGKEDIQPITVATYDSAYLRAPYIGNQFKLIIFDEVHHLPAPGYRSIAEQMIAPYRLGLTATLEREDGLHELIPKLVGGIVYQLGAKYLSEQKHLAEYNINRIQVNLTLEEQKQYDLNQSLFMESMAKLGFKGPPMNNLRRLIMMSNRNKTAREGLLARNKANDIALNSSSKIKELQNILNENKFAKTIIFTQNNKMVYELSNRFLIPFITYKTTKEERKNVLDGFKSGRYTTVVTSKVLDEGIDVPDAELGVIMSGTGSGRELIQRLGRLLRPKQDGKKAKLIEIVSRHTKETNTSAKRITALRKNTEENTSDNSTHLQSNGEDINR